MTGSNLNEIQTVYFPLSGHHLKSQRPPNSRTAVFILNHNMPEETDSLHESLASAGGPDHDLFVLDNGSEAWGTAESTTHRLEENIFWGGALNWAFRFILGQKQYDSLLFLNNDLVLNGAGFVSGLRRELFSGSYQLLSPCLAGAAQPWPQMQCWYSGRTRPVKWIDMQAPLFHRKLIERIVQFDEKLKYGWGQELICARICEQNSWKTGVADHICIEHRGMATLKKGSARKKSEGSSLPIILKEYQQLARSAYEELINSDPDFFRPLVQWGFDYGSAQPVPSNLGASGNPDRTEIINSLIRSFNLSRYLEIGVAAGPNFNRIDAEWKASVDPEASTDARYKMTSDRFFEIIPPEREFDIIFVDGLHEEQQVLRDIYNSLRHLAPGGFIIVHDCNPALEAHQLPEKTLHEWCGTTWKAWARLRCSRRDLEMFVIDTDWGVGVIRRGSQVPFSGKVETFNWQFLEANRDRLLNLVSPERFLASIRDPGDQEDNILLHTDDSLKTESA